MDEVQVQQWRKKLRGEGYTDIYPHSDQAGTEYPDHHHSVATAHIIISGGMMVTDEKGKPHDLKPGDRMDIPADTTHSASVGAEGCEYLIAEKH